MISLATGDELFPIWAERIGKPVEEIRAEFAKILEETKKKHSTEQAAIQNAIMRLKSRYMADLRSTAVWVELLIIGKGKPNFYLQKKWDEAAAILKDSPQEAHDLGYTNDAGQIVDFRKELSNGKANPNFGVPFEEIDYGTRPDGSKVTYADKAVCNVIGIARKKNKDEIKKFNLTLFDFDVKRKIPTLVPLTAKLNVRNESEEFMELGWSVRTKFETLTENVPPEFEMSNIVQGKGTYPITEIPNLESFQDIHDGDFNAVVLTRGMVSSMNLERDNFNLIFLDELSTEIEVDEEGEVPPATMVRVPKDIPIDFAEGSLAYVFGRTWRGTNQDGTPGGIIVDAYNIYLPPEYRVDMESEEQEVATQNAEQVVTNEKDDDFI